jgi:flagellar protein FlaG
LSQENAMKVDYATDRLITPPARGGVKSRPATPAATVPAAADAAPAAAAAAPTEQQLDSAIKSANESMKVASTNLQFERDTDSGKMVVRVIDTDTQAVLRQMPSEEMLAMSKALGRLQGLMVHLKV